MAATPDTTGSCGVRRISWPAEGSDNHRSAIEAIWGALQEAQPVIIQGAVDDWEASKWTPESLAAVCGDLEVVARVGKRSEGRIPRESECFHHRCTLEELCQWLTRRPDDAGNGSETITTVGVSRGSELFSLSGERYFAYLDYKYFHQIFDGFPSLRDCAVNWRRFGPLASSSEPADSVMWMGSSGAATSLHQDAYGSNLVAQLHGAKEWTLIPPGFSASLRPTRIPYEESSVYSRLSAAEVDDHVQATRVTLQPGDVLYVPRHWWHQVRCRQTAISVNVWVPHPGDHEARVEEAMVRAVLAAMAAAQRETAASASHTQRKPPDDRIADRRSCSGPADDECPSKWLNPNEEQVDVGESLDTLSVALAVAEDGLVASAGIGLGAEVTGEQPLRQRLPGEEGCHQWSTEGGVTCKRLFEALTHPEVVRSAVRALRSLQVPQ